MISKEKVKEFASFLEKSGATVLPVTNEWEVIRFKTKNCTSVIYQNKGGKNTYVGEAVQAFEYFKKNQTWRPDKKKRKYLGSDLKQQIAVRDGKACFFCRVQYDSLGELTVEHLLSVCHGGTNNPNNLALACPTCNFTVADMPIVQKIAFRDNLAAAAESKKNA